MPWSILEDVKQEETTAQILAKTEPASSLSSQPSDLHHGVLPSTDSNLQEHFKVELEHAERLLRYAAEMGVELDPDIATTIVNARVKWVTGWDEKITTAFLAALAKLAAKLRPVTAESLAHFEAKTAIQNYWISAIVLVIIVVPASFLSFFSSAVTKAIMANIHEGNALSITLRTQFELADVDRPSEAVGAVNDKKPTTPLPAGLKPETFAQEMQSYAHLTRAIYARSQELNQFLPHKVRDPFPDAVNPEFYRAKFEVPVPLVPPTPNRQDFASVVKERVLTYQAVRTFGQDVIVDAANLNDALTAVILPILYALLGTCAYLLRLFSQQMKTRAFVPSHSDSAHFLMAAIAGAVIGLFNNTTTPEQGVSMSPLAVAFLAGYAVEVFFTFLDGLVSLFTKRKEAAGATPAT